MNNFIKHNLGTIIWSVIIVFVCSIPGSDIPQTPLINIPHFDKIVHAGLYFTLSLFTINSFGKQCFIPKLKVFTLVFTFIYATILGITVELLQYYIIVNRDGDILDAIANSTGSLIAIAFTTLNKKRLK